MGSRSSRGCLGSWLGRGTSFQGPSRFVDRQGCLSPISRWGYGSVRGTWVCSLVKGVYCSKSRRGHPGQLTK